MKLSNVNDIKAFQSCLEKCKGHVELTSSDGNVFNLRSHLMAYVAIGELIKNQGSSLELYCSNREDEALFLTFFKDHPQTI